MLFLSPRFFHSSFIHSTGTCGLPFSTAPQQHPRQSATCATRTRFVCMEKLVDVTILAFSSCKCVRCLGAPPPSARSEGARNLSICRSAGKDEALRLQHVAIRGWGFIPLLRCLNRFQPRSNGTHAAGEFPLGHQATVEHGMDKCEQLTFRRRNVAIHGLCKLVLSSAPVQGWKRTADVETVAHGGQTRLPRWIRIGDAVTRRQDLPLLSLAPHSLEQSYPPGIHLTFLAHRAASSWCEL